MAEKDTIVVLTDPRSRSIWMLLDMVASQGVVCSKQFYGIKAEELKALNPKGIILSGSPDHIYDQGAMTIDKAVLDLGIPILGICYGFQVVTTCFGGKVALGEAFELAPFTAYLKESRLFKDIPAVDTVWMAHYDRAFTIPEGFRLTAHTDTVPIGAIEKEEANIYAVQWHPEEPHSLNGEKLIQNFIFDICGAKAVK